MSASSLLIVLRMYVLINISVIPKSPQSDLIEVSSIAIWNRNRFAVVVSIIVWATNAAFLIQGKDFHLTAPAVT